MADKKSTPKSVEAITHTDAKRKNIPTAEYQSVVAKSEQAAQKVSYSRNSGDELNEEIQSRNPDLDPQLIWRGKKTEDLVVNAPPIYIQEKVHPKVLIDDLKRRTEQSAQAKAGDMGDLFSDFNGIPEGADKTDFYQHEGHWQNRMILGDSLQVMASLAEREKLRGQVQCIYFDPPYGIKFNSNFQWSTTSRDVKDGNASHITREPEQVKAFRDTWRDGIHSYLTYLRDRLTVARDLLTESGSIFVQIGDENVHRVRVVMDEIFGDDNFLSEIVFLKTSGAGSPAIGTNTIAGTYDCILWYAKKKESVKYRQPYRGKLLGDEGTDQYRYQENDAGQRQSIGKNDVGVGNKVFRYDQFTSQTGAASTQQPILINGIEYHVTKGGWKTNSEGARRLIKASRLAGLGRTLTYVRYLQDFPAFPVNNFWSDTRQSGFGDEKTYVVQTAPRVMQRCILMATDPGDLVLDPTCGSGTTAYVAEQWGRRWITIDTSRVALALARARIMGARYPFYLLADSKEGQVKEAEITRTAPSSKPTYGNIRHGFVYERVPHITLKSIANNSEIDVIWDKFEEVLAPLREELTVKLPSGWLEKYRKTQKYTTEVPDSIQEWEIPRGFPAEWPEPVKSLHQEFWQLRIERQKEIDASIAAKADYEYLYDKPYEDKKKVRVAGPFTVESLSPHRMMGVDENDELIDPFKKLAEPSANYSKGYDFAQMILENLKTAGVQQAHKADKINFTSLAPWPGEYICAEGRYFEGGNGEEGSGQERRAAIFVGPEFGTVSRVDLVTAAREAADADFDVLIACAFNYEAHTTEFEKLGRIPVLKARMNADLHMADDLKNTGKGNLFVIFGEPDIDILKTEDGQYQVKVNGVDVFHPNTGEVRSDGPDGIACWFIDTDYNEESFFVRHAYFLGASDPYKSLKTTLKAEINEEAWATLNSDTSRPFEKPKSGRIAVKVINHLGDEVMKVFRV
jgi:adenine-specific DNA-methyltransferase